jgi:hypothetical protein
MRLALLCAGVLAGGFPATPSAAADDPKGPAVLLIQRADGRDGRDFVYFSSFARCLEAAKLLWEEDDAAVKTEKLNPVTRPWYKCLPG